VVDDGSPDNVSEVAARYAKVGCARQKNQGRSAARNAGYRASSGEYLVFLGDRLSPNAIERICAAFRRIRRLEANFYE